MQPKARRKETGRAKTEITRREIRVEEEEDERRHCYAGDRRGVAAVWMIQW